MVRKVAQIIRLAKALGKIASHLPKRRGLPELVAVPVTTDGSPAKAGPGRRHLP
jgi:hypothetical protein